MTAKAKTPAARGPIYLLEDDRPSRLGPTADFGDAPFRSLAPSPLLPRRSRLVDDADSWAMWQAERLELEQTLAAQESCRSLDADAADALRTRMSEIERRVCDIHPSEISSDLSSLWRDILAYPDKARG